MTKIKLIIFLVGITLLRSSLFAQSPGSLLGGSFGLSYSSEKLEQTSTLSADNRTLTIAGTPLAGYKLGDNFMIGIAMEFYLSNTYYDDFFYDKIKATDLLVSPFLRYYFKIPVFLQGQMNAGWSTQVLEGGGESLISDFLTTEDELKYLVFGGGIGLGYDYQMSEHIVLEPSIKYTWNTYEENDSDSDYSKSALLVWMGIYYQF